MATTTLKTWSEGAEDTEHGLEIGGLQITYMPSWLRSAITRPPWTWESRPICWRCGATREDGDYWQLVDWLYRYEEEQCEEREINQTVPHAFAGISDDEAEEDETPKNETDLADLIGRYLSGYHGLDVQTYEEAGVLTSNTGLVVRVTSRDGSDAKQYQITIVRSR